MMQSGDNMKSQSSLKESKKHGSIDFPFEKYNIVSNLSKQFATNHWHDETEIVYIENGSISITINHKRYIGESGDIFIINSGEVHEIYGIGTPLNYTAFVFDFNMLSFRNDDLTQQKYIEPILKGNIQFLNSIKKSEKVFSLMQYIDKLNTQKNACYTLCIKAALLQFLSIIMEEKQIVSVSEPSSKDETKKLLKNVIAYINDHYSEKISLSEIARHFHMSHKYFCRFFKINFNKTFVEYLNDVRIENAIFLLGNKNISVTEAAISCGFSNMSYFTHTFKKKMDCTPSEYKKRAVIDHPASIYPIYNSTNN